MPIYETDPKFITSSQKVSLKGFELAHKGKKAPALETCPQTLDEWRDRITPTPSDQRAYTP